MKKSGRYSLIAVTVVVLGLSLPVLFDLVFERRVNDPLMLYSPVINQFVSRIDLVGHRSLYLDENGTVYQQAQWEELLPFLYYKNLEKQNLLPVELDGRLFSAGDIGAERQALEIKARHLPGKEINIGLYPLFNNDPAVVTMPFPEDVFRFTDEAMEFIGADHNQIDTQLSEIFTGALTAQGFAFPATAIGGKSTNLKPFDEGYFIRDANGAVFHVRRVLNRPEVVRTGIDAALDILGIIVAEHSRRAFYGVIISRSGGIYLISYDDYRLIELPAEGYDPRTMDLKLLFDPLGISIISTDQEKVTGTAVDHDGQIKRRFTLDRSEYEPVHMEQHIKTLLFPWRLSGSDPYSSRAALRLEWAGRWAWYGIGAAFFLLLIVPGRRVGCNGRLLADGAIVLGTGLIGLLAVTLLDEDRENETAALESQSGRLPQGYSAGRRSGRRRPAR